MIKKMFVACLVLVSMGFSGFSKTDASSAACDRECLKGFITKYLDALTAKKPDSLPLAENVKFTENCKQIKVGEGYWKDVNGTVRYRLDIVDVNQSGAGALVVIKGSASVLFALRLKIANQKIIEIETMVTKSSSEGGGIFNPDGFKAPPADSDMTIMPETELLNTRAEMIATASKYPEAMKKGSGTFNKNGLYFSKGAYRLENGNCMAGPGCTMGSGCENIGTQGLPTLSGMVYKPALVDEQAGIVFLRMNFGKGSLMSGSGTLDVFEAFKVYSKDTMHCVYAIMNNVPEGTGFGWDYTAVTNPLWAGDVNNTGKVIMTNKGVSLPVQLFSDKIVLDIFEISGRLVHTETIVNFQKCNAIIAPVNMLPSGHYIGRVRYMAGSKMMHSSFFNVNSI